MLTAEAEKRVKELAKEAATKAVDDYSQGKTTTTSANVTVLETAVEELKKEVYSLVRANDIMANRVDVLESEVKDLQKEFDYLKSDVAGLSK